MARRARRPRRRRRRGSDHLHVHRGVERVADRVHPPLPGRAGGRLETNYRSTPQVLELANISWRIADGRRGSAGKRRDRHAAEPTRTRSFASSQQTRRSSRDRRRGTPAARRGRARRGDGDPRPDERPARWRSRRRSGRPGSRSSSAASGSSTAPRSAARWPGPRRPPCPARHRRRAPALIEPARDRLRARRSASGPTRSPTARRPRERHGAVVTLLEIGRELRGRRPQAGTEAFLAEVGRRTEAEAGGHDGRASSS